MCVCAQCLYACVCVLYLCNYVRVWRPEKDTSVLYLALTFTDRSRSLTEPGTRQVTSKPQGSSCPCPPVLHVPAAMAGFSHGPWYANPGPPACTARTLIHAAISPASQLRSINVLVSECYHKN